MNCLLYPYYHDLSALMQTLPYYNKTIQITKLAAPAAWQYATDAPEDVSYDFDAALKDVEGLVIADTPRNRFMYQDLVKKMQNTLKKHKHVVCATPLQITDQTTLTESAEEHGVRFEYSVFDKKNDARRGIFAPQECVVIGIGGLFKETDSFSSLLYLAHRYRELGYRVTAVSDNANGAMCGFVPFPTKVFDDIRRADDGIRILNSFFNDLQLLYQPDIILTQIPCGMMKYSDLCPDNFGVEAFMLFQAVDTDYLILNVPANMSRWSFYSQISRDFEHRFGCKINAVGVTDKRIDASQSEVRGTIQYIPVKTDVVANDVQKLKNESKKQLLFFDVYDVDSYDELCSASIQIL